MAVALARAPPQRHKWLDRLVAAPEGELRALVDGYADIPPYGRAEPEDAAASLLFGVAADDPARAAFDAGCLALMGAVRSDLLAASVEEYPHIAAGMDRLIAVIRRVRPAGTLHELHAHYARWFGVLETAVLDRGLDLRREFFRLLALTQDESGVTQPRRLMKLWNELCAEAGPRGRYDSSYLDVGLTGLAALPLGADDSANEEAVCHGLARWAERQLPEKPAFLARWREIERAFPRSPTYWPPLVADVLGAMEEEFSGEGNTRISFPAAAWWREELDLPRPARGKQRPVSEHSRPVQPPRPEPREGILHNIAAPVGTLKPRIELLMAQHRRYADATGDVFYLVRTASNIGMRLLRNAPAAEKAARGGIAVELARTALDYAPANHFAWALWRDGLAAQGSLEAAELLGWETIRRFPENPHWRNQLATLLAEARGRPEEARALLDDTIALFPENATARTQLASVLADGLHRYAEARAVLETVLERFPDNPYGYSQLAILLADRMDENATAIAVLRRAVPRFSDNAHFPRLLAWAEAGQRLGRRPAQWPAPPPASESVENFPIDLAAARARRALFRFESGAERDAALQEVQTILAQDENLAYVRYVAEHAGVAPATGIPNSVFAFAFDRAARAGSAAAFQALITQFDGAEKFIARAGLTLVSGGTNFDLPAGANDGDPGAFARRFATLTDGLRKALVDRPRCLRQVADFAAAGLSLDLAA